MVKRKFQKNPQETRIECLTTLLRRRQAEEEMNAMRQIRQTMRIWNKLIRQLRSQKRKQLNFKVIKIWFNILKNFRFKQLMGRSLNLNQLSLKLEQLNCKLSAIPQLNRLNKLILNMKLEQRQDLIYLMLILF